MKAQAFGIGPYWMEFSIFSIFHPLGVGYKQNAKTPIIFTLTLKGIIGFSNLGLWKEFVHCDLVWQRSNLTNGTNRLPRHVYLEVALLDDVKKYSFPSQACPEISAGG